MTEPTGAVYDLGYVPYDGPRTGRRGAIQATVRDGVQRVLGIRRRPRKKILPWVLIALAITPAIVFVGFAFLSSNFSPDVESPFASHADYFTLVGTVVFLFVALAAPELLITDRTEGVLSIYSSRPLRADDYIWARAGGLVLVMLVFLLIPHALMYLGFAGLSSSGFADSLIDDLDKIPKILAAAAGYIAAYAPPALLIAAFAKRKAIAAGIFLAGIPILSGIGGALIEATDVPGHRYGGLLALAEHPSHVRDWIFGRGTGRDLTPALAGFDPWVSLAVILGVAVVSLGIVVFRYRRLM